MLRRRPLILLLLSAVTCSGTAWAGSFDQEVMPLFEASCLNCHDADTETPLNVAALGTDLSDRATFATWEKIYERLDAGEMPPPQFRRPAQRIVDTALTALKSALVGDAARRG